ncbi:hypothetical protein SAMN05216311_101314 [Chitinophaga sp. CF418]|nr:hypothetical protein SAMN05216311_101314 [Chitinophaga sp. CF418]
MFVCDLIFNPKWFDHGVQDQKKVMQIFRLVFTSNYLAGMIGISRILIALFAGLLGYTFSTTALIHLSPLFSHGPLSPPGIMPLDYEARDRVISAIAQTPSLFSSCITRMFHQNRTKPYIADSRHIDHTLFCCISLYFFC